MNELQALIASRRNAEVLGYIEEYLVLEVAGHREIFELYEAEYNRVAALRQNATKALDDRHAAELALRGAETTLDHFYAKQDGTSLLEAEARIKELDASGSVLSRDRDAALSIDNERWDELHTQVLAKYEATRRAKNLALRMQKKLIVN